MEDCDALSVPADVIEKALDMSCKEQQQKKRRVQSCSEEGADGSLLLMQGLALVAKVPLFGNLNPSDHPRLVGAFKVNEYKPNQVIVSQGEPGHSLLIIEGGKAVMKIEGPQHLDESEMIQVGTLKTGDCFGETGFLNGTPWTATVEALETLRVWSLDSSDVDRLGLRHKLRFRRRMAVHERVEAPPEADEEMTVPPKTDEERAFLRNALLENVGLGPLAQDLSEAELDKIMSQAQREEVPEGKEVVRQGDVGLEFFYVIEKGSCTVIRDRELVAQLGPGNSFGERAMLYREPRFSTVRTKMASTLWKVPRHDFKGIERTQLQKRLEDYAALLRRVELLQGTPEAEILRLADALVEVTYQRGDCIVRQGEVGKAFFILYRGVVEVEAKGQEPMRLVADNTKGPEFFGELTLLHDLPKWWTARWRSGSVVAASGTVSALLLDREVFLKVVLRHSPAACTDSPINSPRSERRDPMRSYQRARLEEVGLLGCGRFAKVSLVRCKDTSQVFALKSLLKARVFEMKQEPRVRMEKMILKTTHSPFLIRLVATFNTDKHLDFLLEVALGGDLLTNYGRHNFYGSAEHARFYVACILRGLEHLHERHVIYRDLKLENVLLDASGYAKLTDFGLAKFVIGHTYTRCGTPDYMAPELATGIGHTSAVDWWALGVLAYGIMEGALPFDAPQSCMIFWKVERGIDHACFSDPSASWADLVRDLCKQNPSERLPVRAGGARGVFEHAWFTEAGFDAEALTQRELPAPYKPTLDGPSDLRNFDPDASEAPQENLPYVDPGTGWDADFEDTRGPASLS